MIRKLKGKVIFLAVTAICVLLAVLVAGMNGISYGALVSEADDTLELLGRNEGHFPDMKNDRGPARPRPMSPELPYESRYFSVVLDAAGEVVLTDTGKIASVDPATAASYAKQACDGRVKGFIGNYRYLRKSEGSGIRVVFLDCGRKLDSFRTFQFASVSMALVGAVAAFFVITFFAGRIVRPIAQSNEKQKRFITDAGHELKTPLTIISANADILEMELDAPNESLEDIRRQTQRLKRLTEDLVLLTRMEEGFTRLQAIDFPASEVVAEAVQPFRNLAQTQEKQLVCAIQPTVTLHGNGAAIEQLVSVLMDNALKYTPRGGTIELTFRQTGKTVTLCLSNTTREPVCREDLPMIFDRFYRGDASRNSKTGGHGIGLSVAHAIVTAHGGRIQATSDHPHHFRITATFPG